jgi:hypothetical protein
MSEHGQPPDHRNPGPAPEAKRPTTDERPDEPGATGEPVGNDNIREGRVQGLMGPPHGSQGQGQGG